MSPVVPVFVGAYVSHIAIICLIRLNAITLKFMLGLQQLIVYLYTGELAGEGSVPNAKCQWLLNKHWYPFNVLHLFLDFFITRRGRPR